MKKIILATIVSAVMSSAAIAAPIDAGQGTVTFEGSIIEAACGISPESTDQTVNLGQIAKVQLVDGGTSTPKPFKIELVDCDTSFVPAGTTLPVTTASVTFSGPGAITTAGGTASDTMLAIQGTAKGAGVVISGLNGEIVTINDKTKPAGTITLQDGDNTLLFSAYLQGFPGSTASTIEAGAFQSVANFTMSYE